MASIKCTDHLGNKYPSISAKCKAYNINPNSYRNRIKNNWSEEDALTTPINIVSGNSVSCTDHLGNVFPSIKAKCDYYGIKCNIYHCRKRSGWNEEDALTKSLITTKANTVSCTDHLGNVFPSIKAKCDYYGINDATYFSRIKRGYTEEEALFSGNINKCTDHLGNIFPSVSAKCRAYNISVVSYKGRKNLGWDEERALVTPIKPNENNKPCTDHLGNEYLNLTAKCKAYNMTTSKYRYRVEQGYSEEEALTMKDHYNIQTYQDPITGELLTRKEIVKKYNIDYDKYSGNLYHNYTIIQALNISPHFRKCDIKCNKIVYNLRIDRRIRKDKDVFECYKINEDGTETFRIMSQEMIDQYCLEQYKKEKGLM